MNIDDLIQTLISQGEVTQDEIERKISENKERIENPVFDYEGLTLEQAKGQKAKELSFYCEKTILGYFQSTLANGATYSFSYDHEAQANFNKAGRAFDKALMTSTTWTAYDSNGEVVRVTLDATDFDTVFTDSLTHVNTQIAKFRDDLMVKVETAYANNDIDGIKAIVWA